MKILSVFTMAMLLALIGKSQIITVPNDTIEVGTLSTVLLYFEDNLSPPLLGSGTNENGEPQVYHTLHGGKRIDLLARIPDFDMTNLAIEATNGDVYNFILRYSEYQQNHIFRIKREAAVIRLSGDDAQIVKKEPQEEKTIIVNGLELNKDSIRTLSKSVYEHPYVRSDLGTVKAKAKMKFTVNGIFVYENYLFVRLDIINEGNVKYDLNLIRFVVKPKGKQSAKRVAVQPLPKEELFVYNESEKEVKKGEKVSQVWAFEKFTISKKKSLIVEFWELNGDRSDDVEIPADELINALRLKL